MAMSVANVYDYGAVVRVEITVKDPFSDPPNQPIDPTGISAMLKKPDGTVVNHSYGGGGSIIKTAVGIYRLEFVVDEEGEWLYRFETTGIGQGAVERKIIVNNSAFY
jgi:hypothetical protein